MIKAATIALVAAASLLAVLPAHADDGVASAQQALKDQGFYYGEVTGTKDADTTAAIRRYQIRNGLKITGDLNVETQKSLGVHGTALAQSTPPPAPRATPPPPTAPRATPDTLDLRDTDTAREEPPAFSGAPPNVSGGPAPGYAPGPRGLYPATSGVFDGTPYEVAPADVQRRVLIGAQSLLARAGFYRSAIDGSYGSGTAFALRAYQERFGLSPSGRLDMETLAALGLLPGQRAPGIEAPHRRIYRRPAALPYPGERIYIPR